MVCISYYKDLVVDYFRVVLVVIDVVKEMIVLVEKICKMKEVILLMIGDDYILE